MNISVFFFLHNHYSLLNRRFLNDWKQQYSRDIPSGCKCKMNLYIADYEGYEKKTVINAFKEAMDMSRVRFRKENRKKTLIVTLLILAGLLFIVLSKTVLSALFTDSTMNSIFVEVLDIDGWVFIWEAVTLLFLNPSESLKNGSQIVFKLKSFNLK